MLGLVLSSVRHIHLRGFDENKVEFHSFGALLALAQPHSQESSALELQGLCNTNSRLGWGEAQQWHCLH